VPIIVNIIFQSLKHFIMKSLIMLTLFFCTHCFVSSRASATISSKNLSSFASPPTKKKAYKARVALKFLQLKSKFSPDKKMARLTLIEAVVFLVTGFSLFAHSQNLSNTPHDPGYGLTAAEILSFIFGVFFMIVSLILFIAALITALY
jgi:hypothetical protein